MTVEPPELVANGPVLAAHTGAGKDTSSTAFGDCVLDHPPKWGRVNVPDLVTEMTKVEHPMDVGREGHEEIEW